MNKQEKMLLQYELEQFYYHEANLLDERQFLAWLSLLDEDIRYLMHHRYNPQRDAKLRDTEDFQQVSDELSSEGADGLPIRDENIFVLSLRAQRSLKHNAWGDNPPMLTRRFISNLCFEIAENGDFLVKTNFQVAVSRWGKEPWFIIGKRQDELSKGPGEGFKIVRREILLDQTIVHQPTLGLLI